jgi:hypothetical protein
MQILYKIKKWFVYYSSQQEILHQLGAKFQEVEESRIPIPDILLVCLGRTSGRRACMERTEPVWITIV